MFIEWSQVKDKKDFEFSTGDLDRASCAIPTMIFPKVMLVIIWGQMAFCVL